METQIVQPDHTSLGRPLSRRVVTAAAWSAPIVLIARPAPALAASVSGTLHFNYLNGYGATYVNGVMTELECGLSVQNLWTSGSPTLDTITVKVTIPDSRVDGDAATIVVGTPAWSASAPVQAGPTWVYTLTYSGSVAPGGSTGDLKFRVSLNNSASGSFAIAATASAEAVTGASTTATVHF